MQIKCNAKDVIVSRERYRTGSYRFFTGILETDYQNWYCGNDYQIINRVKIISICLFHFSADNSRLMVYYFAAYDKGNTFKRLQFANAIIPQLLKPLLA